MKICPSCGKDVEGLVCYRGHLNKCRKIQERLRVAASQIDGIRLCDFGCGLPAKFALKSGKVCCEKNYQSCSEMRRKNSEKNKGRPQNWKNGHPKGMFGKRSWLAGKTHVESFGEEKARIISERISKSLTGKKTGEKWKASCPQAYQQWRMKISSTAQKNKKSGGYRKGSGCGKSGWYKGIWCDSSWELAWVMYNLDHGIPFVRNRDRFEYEWKGKVHKYLPDFKMQDGQYVEVKAWLNDQGRAKIAACAGVKVLMKSEMEPFIQYAVEKYGKDYIRLYEER